MQNVFVISDTHFGHAATLATFKQPDGFTPLRPFSSIEEMHECIADNWNETVGVDDLVIHCGDVSKSGFFHDKIMPKLKGKKYLVRGNHGKYSAWRSHNP